MKCTYSLSHFHILLHGESWYNTFGFKSKTHERDKHHNEEVRNLPLDEFIQRATDTYIKNKLRDLDFDCDVMGSNPYLYTKELDQYGTVESFKRTQTKDIMKTKLLDMDNFITTFRTTKDTQVSRIVSDIFTNFIKKEKPTLCDNKIQLLKQLIDCSRYVLKYSRVLIREPRSNGGNRKTRKYKN